MYTIDPHVFLAVTGGIVLAVIVMLASVKAVSRAYEPITAPLARVRVVSEGDEGGEEGKERRVPYYDGFLSLYSVFFMCAMIFAFTRGALTTLSVAPNDVDERALAGLRYEMVYWVCVGVMVAVLARISAVCISTAYTKRLEIFTVATLGVLTFKLVQDFPYMKTLVDVYMYPAGGPYFPVFAFGVCAVSLLSVELGFYLISRFAPHANRVAYSLLRERVEQYTETRQVFWPSHVVPFTEKSITRIIGDEGLSELCWLTNTAPPTHMEIAFEATKKWLGKNRPNVDQLAGKIMKAATRVIVTSDLGEKRVKRMPYVRRRQRLKDPVRIRMMIINMRHAIVHLPIPFGGGAEEESNCLMLVESPECVHALREEFDALWENRHLLGTMESLNRFAGEGRTDLLNLAWLVYMHHSPITIGNLTAEYNGLSGSQASIADVQKLTEELKARDVITAVGGQCVVSSRHARTCRIADFLRRLRS